MSTASNKKIIEAFIQQVWNERRIENLDHFIHEDYSDHSFVKGVPPNKSGLQFWIQSISASFEHHTIIEFIVAENDMVLVRIAFKAKHIGRWRDIAPTGKEVKVKGFRQFELKEGKILSHWALLDGESMESGLSEVHKGCTVPTEPVMLIGEVRMDDLKEILPGQSKKNSF